MYENKQKEVKNSTAKAVNLPETSRHTAGVYQEQLTLYKVLNVSSFLTALPLKCNDRWINGMFHSRCLDFHTNEKIIILELALSEEDVYKDKTNFFPK